MADREKKPENKRLDRYMGRLSAKEIAEGMNCAIDNAERLVEDAELLVENKRYPSAVALAILAIEEEGKEAVLRSLAVARNQEEVRDAWKSYRTHTEKNMKFAMPEMTFSGARKLDDFRPIFNNAEFPQIIENLKQISIYTDCLGKAHWSIPLAVINEKLALQIVAAAKLVIGKKNEVSEKEIEIWIKHLGPVWKRDDLELMKTGLRNFYMEMSSAGLLRGKLEEHLAFIDGKKAWVH